MPLPTESTRSEQLASLPGNVHSALSACVTRLLIGGLRAYKLVISPLLGNRCRFHPSCSVYAQESIQRFGPIKGAWLGLLRLGRCGPWHPGGIDEVPERNHSHSPPCGQCQQGKMHHPAAVNRNRA